MEDSTSAAPQAAATPSRIMVISEGEINVLKQDLRKLSQLIVGLAEGFDKLQDQLVGVSQTEHPNITANCWMAQVRELFYDTGDYLYDSMYSGKEFKIFKSRAEDAIERVERYEIQPKTPFVFVERLLPSPPLASQIDDDYKDMVHEVDSRLGTGKKLKVVSIVGPEGVGKTTLARRLYHRYIDRSGGTLQCRAFLTVSAKPDILRLLTHMSMQIQFKVPSCHMNEHQLVDSIAAYLQDKRYFIVIDDLWAEEDVWDIISRAFPPGDCCSRVITTTQMESVALACCGHQPNNVFTMVPLNYEKSQNLFFRTVFGFESDCPKNLKEVSNRIIKKCGGLPLTIINIASMLPSVPNPDEWTRILDSLPSTWRTDPTSKCLKEVVTLMYNTLRPHLKTCLLCFSMYPEGFIVRKDGLVKQWVLEDILDEGTEETAGGYFDELVRRGMIQPVYTNKNGDVLSCTLHRTIHDVIVNKSIEEKFVIQVDRSETFVALHDKVRRLSVQFGGATRAHIPDSMLVSKVRSLAFFGFFQCLTSIDNYRLLRVLILHIWADQNKDSIDLAGISQLLWLRYMKIACNNTVKLPDKIQRQQDLEILEVEATLAAIPWDIEELSKLRILKIDVRELSREDIRILKELVALTTLSIYVKTAPTETVVFGKDAEDTEEGFLNLKFFTLWCRTPCLVFKESSMPKIEKLSLCFNIQEAREDGTKPITIEHLPGLKEISVIIGGALADSSSALADAVTNHPRNPVPIVQLMESREELEHAILEGQYEIMEEGVREYPGTQEQGLEECEITEEDSDESEDEASWKVENKDADDKISMAAASSPHLPDLGKKSGELRTVVGDTSQQSKVMYLKPTSTPLPSGKESRKLPKEEERHPESITTRRPWRGQPTPMNRIFVSQRESGEIKVDTEAASSRRTSRKLSNLEEHPRLERPPTIRLEEESGEIKVDTEAASSRRTSRKLSNLEEHPRLERPPTIRLEEESDKLMVDTEPASSRWTSRKQSNLEQHPWVE